MKTRIAMMTAVIMITMQIGTAMEPAKKYANEGQKIEYAKKNIKIALRSENPGVIESAIRLTAILKMIHPENDVTALTSVIEEISNSHQSGCLRYKAYIALHVCSDPGWYTNDVSVKNADQEMFFRTASNRMQEKLLSENTF